MAKVVGNCIYIHKSNVEELMTRLTNETNKMADIIVAMAEIDKEKHFKYEVIKCYKRNMILITFTKLKQNLSIIRKKTGVKRIWSWSYLNMDIMQKILNMMMTDLNGHLRPDCKTNTYN